MNSTAPSKPAESDVARFAWRSPFAVAFFLALVLVTLGADLYVKAASFEHVADVPIRLKVSPAGDPVVLLPNGQGDWAESTPRKEGYAATAIPPHDGVTVVPGLLDLNLTINEGAVFGAGQGFRWVFIGVSVVAVGLISVVFGRSAATDWPMHLSLALILAGALGNLYDRTRFAAVRDMFHLFPEHGLWPWIFNVADVALVGGVSMVVAMTWLRDARQRRHEQAEATAQAES